jgi:hypothetical protein
MQSDAAPRCLESPSGFRLSWITYPTVKSVSRLSAVFRRQVSKELAGVVPSGRCTSVKNLQRYCVYHFDVNETVRVCFRLLGDGRAVVIHVGTHAEFNHFAKHYRGTLPRITPIQECELMKATRNGKFDLATDTDTRPSPGNGQGPRTRAAWAETLTWAIQEAVNHGLAAEGQRRSEDIDTLTELIRTETAGRIKPLADKITALVETVNSTTTSLRREVSEAVDRSAQLSMAESRHWSGQFAARLAEQQSAIDALAESSRQMPCLQKDVLACEGHLVDLAASVKKLEDSIESRVADSSRFCGVVEDRFATQQDALDALGGTLASVEELRSDLGKRKEADVKLRRAVAKYAMSLRRVGTGIESARNDILQLTNRIERIEAWMARPTYLTRLAEWLRGLSAPLTSVFRRGGHRGLTV